MTAVIAVTNLRKRFGEVVALDGVSLEIAANEFVALLGPSGCGKTTLLRAIAGLEQPDEGQILIEGQDHTTTPPYRRPVNMMFQSYALFPHMTVAENIAFGLKQDGLAGAALTDRTREALASVEMEALGARKPHQLSGGQRQRAALARCLAKRPRALLLDEPLAALDKHLRERTQLELMALRERLGIAFVVVTHDQDEAMAMASRVAVMQAGRLLQVGTPRELYERPATRAVAGFFGHVNLLEGKVTAPGTVDCPALPLACKVATSVQPGAAVTIAVRPEQIAFAAADNSVAGTVTEVVYGGTVSTYFVTTPAGARLRVVRQNNLPAVERGAAVTLGWSAAAAQVLNA